MWFWSMCLFVRDEVTRPRSLRIDRTYVTGSQYTLGNTVGTQQPGFTKSVVRVALVEHSVVQMVQTCNSRRWRVKLAIIPASKYLVCGCTVRVYWCAIGACPIRSLKRYSREWHTYQVCPVNVMVRSWYDITYEHNSIVACSSKTRVPTFGLPGNERCKQ